MIISGELFVKCQFCFSSILFILLVNVIYFVDCSLIAGAYSHLSMIILAFPFSLFLIKLLQLFPEFKSILFLSHSFHPLVLLILFIDLFDMFFIILIFLVLLLFKFLQIISYFFISCIQFLPEVLTSLQIPILLTSEQMLLILRHFDSKVDIFCVFLIKHEIHYAFVFTTIDFDIDPGRGSLLSRAGLKRILLFENCSAFISILVGASEKNSSLMRAIMNKIIFIFQQNYYQLRLSLLYFIYLCFFNIFATNSIIICNNKMHIFEKFTNAIAEKQQQSLASFNLGRSAKGFQSMVEDIQEEIEDNFKESMEKHVKNIEEYLFGDQNSIQKVKESFNWDRVELMIEDQHEKFLQNLQEDILKITEQALPIDTDNTIERPIRIQRQVIEPPSQMQQVEQSPQIPTKDMSHLPPPDQVEKVQSKNYQPPLNARLLQDESDYDYDQPLIPPNYHQPLLNQEYRNLPMKTNNIADISWDFNISHNIEEQVIGKLSEAIEEKQKQAMQNTEEAIQKLMKRKSFPQFWEDLLGQFHSHVEEEIDKHSKNITENLLDLKILDFNFAKMFKNIADTVEQKHEDALTQFESKMKGTEGYTLEIDLYRQIERPQRIQMAVIKPPVQTDIPFTEESKQMVMESQDAKESNPFQLENIVHAIEEYIQEEYMFLSEDPPNVTIQHPSSTISDRPIAETTTPITKPNLATSQVLIKRDIVKELEERRRKMQEKELKSKKMKTKLVKLEPIASKEERLIKEKEAREKIDAQVNFVKGIGDSRKTASFKIHEWKQQSNKNYQYDVSKTENTPNKYSKRKIQNFRLNQSAHYDLSDSNVMKSSYRKQSQKEKSFILRKPMPYNLYNVNFKEHEQFRLGNK